ncbi:MAG TPA: hypothetical protein VF081_09685 [Solirubrobacterales bacterium]
MNGRRTIVGLCMLCVLLVSAFAAQSASAITGTTAFTCSKGSGTLRGEHCLTTGTAAAEYGHVAFSENATTELIATNAKSATNTTAAPTAKLKVTIAGVPLEIGATGVSASGWIENKVGPSKEHYVHGKGTITFTGVQVTKPENRGCKVTTDKEPGEGEEGVVHTTEVTLTTENEGDALALEPVVGDEFMHFWVTCEVGKQIPAIEGTWTCTGILKGVPEGATVNFTHATTTTHNTFKCRGTKAGMEGSLTLSGRNKGSEAAYAPLSMTTVTT